MDIKENEEHTINIRNKIVTKGISYTKNLSFDNYLVKCTLYVQDIIISFVWKFS